MKAIRIIAAALVLASAARAASLPQIQTVFVIVLENHNWSSFEGKTNAPFINGVLLPRASYCGQYYNPPALHPSLPNYLWLEAGTNFGILDDNDPAINHQHTTNHLASQLRRAGISWKTYQEDISGTVVPLTSVGGYRPKHNPFAYFDDMTGTNNPNDAYGIAHNRPYTELAGDLASNNVARYNFITPNLCDDGHDTCSPQNSAVRQTDDWLAGAVPAILNSAAYSNNGAIFITWDEGAGSSDGPIGMIVLSPLARGGGYFNNIHYTHSSFLRTMQEIFGVSPLLRDAANATSLSDLFAPYAIQISARTNGTVQLSISGVVPGRTNLVQTSTNLSNWQAISTNWAPTNSFAITNQPATNNSARFYRVIEAQ
jgi:hypothetical protein